MTHDELLEILEHTAQDGMADEPILKALRAVVELHKPSESDFPDEWESCIECSGNGYEAMYPCPTIKAIEKELNG